MIWSNNGTPGLAAENFQLKKRLAALEARASSPISANPQTGEVKIDNFQVGPLSIEKLDLTSKALSDSAAEVDKFATLEAGSLKLPEFKKLTEKPLLVRALKAAIPLPFVNSALEQIAGAQLSKAGLSDLQIGQTDDGLLKVTGKARKGLQLPFEVTGRLSATPEGKVKFQIARSKVGSIPMPDLVVTLATKLAGEKLEKAGVTAEGKEFTLDPRPHKPSNLIFQLKNLSVGDGAILIEGGAPVVSRPSPIPKIPRKK